MIKLHNHFNDFPSKHVRQCQVVRLDWVLKTLSTKHGNFRKEHSNELGEVLCFIFEMIRLDSERNYSVTEWMG